MRGTKQPYPHLSDEQTEAWLPCPCARTVSWFQTALYLLPGQLNMSPGSFPIRIPCGSCIALCIQQVLSKCFLKE